MEELINISDSGEDFDKDISKVIKPVDWPEKTLDYWDPDYRPPDYHTKEEAELFCGKHRGDNE
jgi:hypothetical protein